VKRAAPIGCDAETAALRALGALSADEREAFDAALADAPAEVRQELDELRRVAQDLALAVAPVAPAADLRERLLARVASEAAARQRQAAAGPGAGFLFTRDTEVDWRPAGAGVQVKSLTPGAGSGKRAYLVRVDGGATVRKHEHPVDEHCYILEGDFIVGDVRLGPGDYHCASAGTVHRDLRSESGCVFLVVEGAAA